MREAEADKIFDGVVNRDAVEDKATAKCEVTQIRSRRWCALSDTYGDAVAVEPRVAELHAKSGNETAMADDRLDTISLDRELCSDCEIERADGTTAGQAERASQRGDELSRIACAGTDVLHCKSDGERDEIAEREVA